MTKQRMIMVLDEQLEKALVDERTWSRILDNDLEELEITRDEAYKDKSIFQILSYRIWLQAMEKTATLETLKRAYNEK